MSATHRGSYLIVLILGALSTISPFSIDMYLPAFPQIAEALNTSVARVALSLSSYFVGLSVGQIFYGPLLDRFGRKRPLYFGLGLYLLTSIACLQTQTVESLIALRFLQALGGCAAQVAAMAMVRDFFPVEEGAKVFSLLMLILGVSPLLAPSVGGLVTTWWGWHSVFIILAAIVLLILLAVIFLLPEGHKPDPRVSLKPWPIALGFVEILKNPQFYTYAFSGAFAFAGLFVYVASSPIIFMDLFHLSAKAYGGVFAMLSVGFIGGSQVNLFLTRRYRSEVIYHRALCAQALVALIFIVGTLTVGYGLYTTVGLFFLYLLVLGLGNPNGAALALAPFESNAGRASALLGFLQIGLGALASAAVGLFEARDSVPAFGVLATTSFIGLGVLLLGRRNLTLSAPASGSVQPALH